ncbi:MAG: hypothetical protein WC794_02105 [Candidatus Doudnabacteria bacterium]|jgi:hypothetical protein
MKKTIKTFLFSLSSALVLFVVLFSIQYQQWRNNIGWWYGCPGSYRFPSLAPFTYLVPGLVLFTGIIYFLTANKDLPVYKRVLQLLLFWVIVVVILAILFYIYTTVQPMFKFPPLAPGQVTICV